MKLVWVGMMLCALACSPPMNGVDAGTGGGSGGSRSALATARCRWSITSFHTGAAPETPDTSCIGKPLALPTHTPTVYRSDQPNAQLSRMSLLVPVFTAVQKRVPSTLSSPKVRARAIWRA